MGIVVLIINLANFVVTSGGLCFGVITTIDDNITGHVLSRQAEKRSGKLNQRMP